MSARWFLWPSALVAPAVVAAVAAAGCARAPERSPTVDLTIEHSRFQPDRLEVSRGATVRFVIRNTDPIDHEFILGDQEVQDRHETGTEPSHGPKPGEVSIPAGRVASTTYTFTEPGTLIFGCHLPGHYGYGMRGVVFVSG